MVKGAFFAARTGAVSSRGVLGFLGFLVFVLRPRFLSGLLALFLLLFELLLAVLVLFRVFLAFFNSRASFFHLSSVLFGLVCLLFEFIFSFFLVFYTVSSCISSVKVFSSSSLILTDAFLFGAEYAVFFFVHLLDLLPAFRKDEADGTSFRGVFIVVINVDSDCLFRGSALSLDSRHCNNSHGCGFQNIIHLK